MPLPIRRTSNLALPEKVKDILNQAESGDLKAENEELTDHITVMAVTEENLQEMIANHPEEVGSRKATTNGKAKAEEKLRAVINPGETEDKNHAASD